MYLHKVEGEYITAGKLGEIEFYETEFELEEGDPSLARCIIHRLVGDKLRKTVKNYRRWKTCQVVGTEKLTEKSDKSPEVDPELEALILECAKLGCTPVNFESYKSDAAKKRRLREALEKQKSKIAKSKKKLKGTKNEELKNDD